MEYLISVSFGEIFLKGKNKNIFFKRAKDNIKRNISDIGFEQMYIESSKLYIKAKRSDFNQIIPKIRKVFGISYISEVIKCEKDLDSITLAAKNIIDQSYTDKNYTFVVRSTRTDKSYPYKSPEINSIIGERIFESYDNLSVKLKNSDFTVYIDIKQNAYVYIKRYEGLGGMPVGSSGSGLLLLSGGIDSPVAGYMMAKRGMEINAIHFHSHPFTSPRAFQKAMDLAKILADYTGKMTVYSVNLAEIYKQINKNCDRRETTILSRRFMMRIANNISEKYDYKALITGESLGQVASQTLESMSVIEDSSDIPILRPLIGMDKKDIIDISVEIGSYEKSIEPFDDCCSIFAPSSPVTKPKLKFIEKSEEKLDIKSLEEFAISNMEIIEIS